MILLIICLLDPQVSIEATKQTINLWFSSVLPVLFPFFIISKILYNNGGTAVFAKLLRPFMKFLNLPGDAAFPLAMSLLCGYPTGSRIVSDMQKNGLKNYEYYANICYSSGPLFIIGSVGTLMLKSTQKGYALMLIHLCTLIIFTVLTRPKHLNAQTTEYPTPSGSFGSAIAESITAILQICGFMVFFSVISGILFQYVLKDQPPLVNGLISGFLEFTSGIKIISMQNILTMPIISFYLSFGGCCVIAQCLAQLNGINKKKFIANRVLCGIIAFLLCYIYEKTALYVPVLITICIAAGSFAGKRIKGRYLLKSSKS
jgi:uncharcaterized membrane protein, YLBJ B.subtilis homolog